MSARDNQKIVKYVKKLKRSLSHLSVADREDIAKEIEGHIVERWELDSKGMFDEGSLAGVLGKMGSPEFLAAQYCEQRGWARPPKKHTARNIALGILAFILISIIGVVYVTKRFVVDPVARVFKGEGSVLSVSDSGVKMLGGKISIDDNGIKVGNEISIDDRGIIIDGKKVDVDAKFELSDGEVDIFKLVESNVVAKEKNSSSADVGNSSRVKLNTKNGRITIKGTDAKKVTVDYEKKVYGKDKKDGEAALKEMGVNVQGASDGVTIDGVFPESTPSGVDEVVIDMTISIPRSLALEIEVKNFGASIQEIGGSVDLSGKNGRLELANVAGSVTINMKNGKLGVSGVGGALVAEMKNGTLDVAGIGGDANIEMKNGQAKVDGVGGDLTLEVKNVPVKVSDVKGDMNIQSKMSPVNVRLAKGYEFDMLAASDMAPVNADFPVSRSGDEARAKVGSGKHKVTIHSKMGAISVMK